MQRDEEGHRLAPMERVRLGQRLGDASVATLAAHGIQGRKVGRWEDGIVELTVELEGQAGHVTLACAGRRYPVEALEKEGAILASRPAGHEFAGPKYCHPHESPIRQVDAQNRLGPTTLTTGGFGPGF